MRVINDAVLDELRARSGDLLAMGLDHLDEDATLPDTVECETECLGVAVVVHLDSRTGDVLKVFQR